MVAVKENIRLNGSVGGQEEHGIERFGRGEDEHEVNMKDEQGETEKEKEKNDHIMIDQTGVCAWLSSRPDCGNPLLSIQPGVGIGIGVLHGHQGNGTETEIRIR